MMAFALRPDQTGARLAASLRAILREQLGAVQRVVVSQTPSLDVEIEAIHEARKACKRARTVVRLLHDALGAGQARGICEQVAQVARRLSMVRDEQMLAEIVAKLHAEVTARAGVKAERLVHAIEYVQRSQPPSTETSVELELRQQLHDELADLLLRFEGLGLAVPLARSLERGFARLWRRLRRAYHNAYAEPSTERFHSLRKRVKDCFYAVCLLEPLHRHRLSRLKRRLDRLADQLGLEHDLALLAERLRYDPSLPEAISKTLLTHIAVRREKLRQAVQPTTRRLVRRQPARLSRRTSQALRQADGS
jgi:CHAD domain-containing protein